MDSATRVQILYKAVCISHYTNTLEKGINFILLPQEIIGETRLFNLGMATSLRERKL